MTLKKNIKRAPRYVDVVGNKQLSLQYQSFQGLQRI